MLIIIIVLLTYATYHYSAKRSLMRKCFLFSVTVLFFLACSSNKKVNTNKQGNEKPPFGGLGAFDTQGHRGCRGLMPENTIPAMLYALDLGVTTLEKIGRASCRERVSSPV